MEDADYKDFVTSSEDEPQSTASVTAIQYAQANRFQSHSESFFQAKNQADETKNQTREAQASQVGSKAK